MIKPVIEFKKCRYELIWYEMDTSSKLNQ